MQDYNNNFLWLETNKIDNDNFNSYYFINPIRVIKLLRPNDLSEFFLELEDLSKRYYVAGFFSYELGLLLEEAFTPSLKFSFPYALFCAYDRPVIFDHRSNRFVSGNFNMPQDIPDYKVENLRLSISEEEYIENIKTIRDYIREGDVYQVNYTIKYYFDLLGSPLGLYLNLKQEQNVAYNVFAKFDDYYILSLTPELFFQKKGNVIRVKPMKGTYKRGRNIYEDRENSLFLKNDEKNRSENVMIVDLLRNDIGKVSEKGTVEVKRLYEIEKYNTLFQMTSTIESTLEKNISIYDLIKSIFPSGSVTGAPKIRSMEIINQLEREDRRIYTGSIGFFEPSGNARFNVAIRTLLIRNNTGEMGIGGGIVYDSKPDEELFECKLKANFLIQKTNHEFCLIETILFDKNYKLLQFHLKRLQESAEYFNFKFHKTHFYLQLNRISLSLVEGRYRVRVLLKKSGEIQISYTKLKNLEKEYSITSSECHTDSNNIFYFHKTTNRELYERELKKAREKGFFDVVFMNERDEITECSITNIYIKKDEIIYTPPIQCGLLNGTIRQYMIDKNDIKEKILSMNDLKNADAIYISNSIIGFKRATYCGL